MNAKAIFILFICTHQLLTTFSLSTTGKPFDERINDLLGPLVENIVKRYFIHGHCTCVITEGDGNILKYIPETTSVYLTQIGGTGSVIKELEESNTLDSTKLTISTQYFEKFLIQTMDAGCESYIIQVRNIRSVVHSFGRTTRRAATRYCKKYLYLPVTLEDEILHLQNVFSMTEMNYMPDLIVARLTNLNKRLNFNNDKVKLTGNWNADVEMDSTRANFQEIRNESQGKLSFHGSGNSEVLKAGHNCESSKGLSCIEATEPNKYINLFRKKDTSKLTDNIDAIEMVTPKFVGKTPSSEVVLDVWRADNQNPRFVEGADLYPDKMVNLKGREIGIVTFNYLPFVVMINDEKSPVYDGIEFLTFLQFAKKLNFTWKLVLDEENMWGAVWSNGSGNGVVGFVAEDRVDIGFAALYAWHSTYQWTDPTTAYCSSAITCLVPKPKMLPRWMSLWLPFSSVMWAAVTVSFIVITVASYSLARASHKYLGTTTLESYTTMINCFLTTLGMFVLQAPPEAREVHRGPMRGYVTTLLIFFLLVSSVFSGGLASILTVSRYERPIDTVRQLADSNLPWVGSHEAWLWSLQESDEPLDKTLIRHFKFVTEEDLPILSTQGKTALPIEKLAGGHYSVPNHINEAAIQTLRIMKDMMYGSHIIMLTRKTSPYMERLNSLISSLYETGMMHYWEGQTIRRYMSERLQIAIAQSVVLNNQDGPAQLMIEHLQGAFIILALGLSLATILFVVEVAGGFFKRYHLIKKTKLR